MSRVAKSPVIVPDGVNIKINGQIVKIEGKNGKLTRIINDAVEVKYINNTLIFNPRDGYVDGWVQAGTTRALLKAMIIGVTEGFIKKLQLVGIGYRAMIEEDIIKLSLGLSHSISYKLPLGVKVECPSQTEIILKGADKQIVGQTAANLRAYRRPESYKGRGIRYFDEIVRIKEIKKISKK